MSCAPSSVISQSSACRAKPFILKCDFTLVVIIFTSATLHGNALYCALLDLLTSMHEVRLDAVKYSYPMYWVSEHKSFDVCLQVANSNILIATSYSYSMHEWLTQLP